MMKVGPWLRRMLSPPATPRRDAVLVFAEDPLLASLFEAALLPAGFDVLLVGNVEDGIVSHWRHRGDIALVVVADRVPGMSVEQLLACLRAADPAAPCRVLTVRPATVAEAREFVLPYTRPVSRQSAGTC